MNIAIVTPEFPSEKQNEGGLSNYTFRLCRSLMELGCKPTVFVYSDKDEQIDYEGITVHRVKLEAYDNKIYYSTSKISKIYVAAKKFLKRHIPYITELNQELLFKHYSRQLNNRIRAVMNSSKFDLIHYAHLGGVGYDRINELPCVARLSSSTSEYEKFGGFGGNKHEMIAQEKVELAALKKMDTIFGPSKTIAATVSAQIGLPIDIIESPYVPEKNTLDPTVYQQKLNGLKYLLFFGHISLIKGAGTIAKIIKRFLEMHPEHYFVFIGRPLASEDPNLNMIEYIQEQAGPYADRIIHLQNLPHVQLYPILQHAQFCVLPSRIDNFPNTCIESMANGKIVIGTRGNGFEQLINHGNNGFLVNVDDPESLLNTINHILKLSPEEKKKIEESALNRAELLKPEKVITQLIELYNKTIHNFKN